MSGRNGQNGQNGPGEQDGQSERGGLEIRAGRAGCESRKSHESQRSGESYKSHEGHEGYEGPHDQQGFQSQQNQQSQQGRQNAQSQLDRPSPKNRLPGLLANLAYPLVILAAWRWLDARYTGCILFALLCVQRYAGRGRVAGSLRRLTALEWAVAGLLSVACAAIALTGSDLLLRLYPLLVNLGLLSAFGATLVRGPSMIEKFARLAHGECDAHVVRYTRRVTWVWCAFFVLNGAFSAYTALYCTRGVWSLYNGLIAYVLMGLLIVGELAWRKLVQRAQRVGEAGCTGRADAHRPTHASRPEGS